MPEAVEGDLVKLTDREFAALCSIWPASGPTPMTWSRGVSRHMINSLTRRGLIGESDLTELGRAAIKAHAARISRTPLDQEKTNGPA